MLLDRPRTNAYRDAMERNAELFRGATVIDVGCGTGVLSLFAAKAGAKRVFCVECKDPRWPLVTPPVTPAIQPEAYHVAYRHGPVQRPRQSRRSLAARVDSLTRASLWPPSPTDTAIARVAEAIVRANGMEAVVTVVQSKLEEAELGLGPGSVDIIVSEWM